MSLILETRIQPDRTPSAGPVMITPAIDEDYWMYRVRLSEHQAIVGFPKFGTIGIGFAQEEDWNTNLPYSCETDEIFEHIRHNKGGDSIPDSAVHDAIELVRQAAKASRDAPAGRRVLLDPDDPATVERVARAIAEALPAYLEQGTAMPYSRAAARNVLAELGKEDGHVG